MRAHSRYGHKSEAVTMLLKIKEELSTRTIIGEGATSDMGRVLEQCQLGKRVLMLAPRATSIMPLAQEIASTVRGAGYECDVMDLADGEAGKSHESLLAIWQRLQELNFQRKDTLLAVGGGAVTDVAGFAAATYLRGINVVLVPTTLLAQVDASIGGKTGINLPAGKNLAGAFYFPTAVVIDPNTIEGLPERQWRSGLGEIIKYACIEQTIGAETEYRAGPRKLLAVLEDLLPNQRFAFGEPDVLGIISACVRMKLAVVAKDPREGRLRRCLNLGHTLGHAIEKVSNYGWTHGEAVAIGLVFACRLAERLGKFPAEETARLVTLLHEANLPVAVPAELPREALLKAMAFDKKRADNAIKFVLPIGALGTVDIDCSVTLEQLEQALIP